MIFDPSLNERDCGRFENAELLQLDQLVEAEALQPVILRIANELGRYTMNSQCDDIVDREASVAESLGLANPGRLGAVDPQRDQVGRVHAPRHRWGLAGYVSRPSA